MDQGVRTVNAEPLHPLIAGADDRNGRGIQCDNLRGKDSCDAGRRSGKRNGVCWKMRPWMPPMCTESEKSAYKTRRPVRSSPPSGASGRCAVGRGVASAREEVISPVFTRLLWRRLLAEQKGSFCGSGQMVPDLVCQRCERIPIRNLVRFRVQQANRPLLSGGISAFVLATAHEPFPHPRRHADV
jgi:hypothetical protein